MKGKLQLRRVEVGYPLLSWMIIFAALVLLPLVAKEDPFLESSLILVFIFALFGASWDFTFGITGLPNFGPGLPFGVGAFVLYLVPRGINPLLGILISGAVASASGILMWTPSIRLRGSYLSIVTLLLVLLFQDLAFTLTSEEGVSFGLHYFAVPLVVNYYTALAITSAGSIFLYSLSRSRRIGLRLKAIKDDEIAAQAISIDVTNYKLFAFVVSAFFAGISGAYLSIFNSSVNYTVFSVTNDFLPIVVTVIGGPGTILGAWLGSLLVELPSLYLVAYGPYSLIIYGATMIVIVLFVRGGILGGLAKISERVRRAWS